MPERGGRNPAERTDLVRIREALAPANCSVSVFRDCLNSDLAGGNINQRDAISRAEVRKVMG
jgi:hypothetical protein